MYELGFFCFVCFLGVFLCIFFGGVGGGGGVTKLWQAINIMVTMVGQLIMVNSSMILSSKIGGSLATFCLLLPYILSGAT